jgi:hypothetical protein
MLKIRGGGLAVLKLAVTALALSALVLRMIFPDLLIDAVGLGLIVLAFLPWLSPLVKSAELPGGFKIEFQDVKDAAEKVTAGFAGDSGPPPTADPAFLALAEQDPNLALVALRIEVEKRLRSLAEKVGIPPRRSLAQLTIDLQQKGVLDPQSASGLRDLIALGNQAAHGQLASSDVAVAAAEYAPIVLRALDAKLVPGAVGEGSRGAERERFYG